MNGEAIRILRRDLHLTQALLGLKIGVHGCTVGRWERGVHKPRQAHADRLAQLREMPIPQAIDGPVLSMPMPAEDGPRRSLGKATPAQTIGGARRSTRKSRSASGIRGSRRSSVMSQAAPIIEVPGDQPASSSPRWTLHTGDCLDVAGTLPDGACDALITDPPYCSGGLHLGSRQQKTRRKYQQNSVRNRRQDFDGDQRDQLAFIAWLTEALRRCARVVRRGGLVAVFSDWRQQGATQTALQAAGFALRGCAVWDKTEGARPVPSRLRNQAEFIHWGSKGDLTASAGIPTQAGVYRHAVRANDKFHLTGKPTEVMRWLVRQVQPGGRILDPFAGSGSTGVAALLEGRSFVGIEQDAHYAQVAGLRLSAAERGQRLDARRIGGAGLDLSGRTSWG